MKSLPPLIYETGTMLISMISVHHIHFVHIVSNKSWLFIVEGHPPTEEEISMTGSRKGGTPEKEERKRQRNI